MYVQSFKFVPDESVLMNILEELDFLNPQRFELEIPSTSHDR